MWMNVERRGAMPKPIAKTPLAPTPAPAKKDIRETEFEPAQVLFKKELATQNLTKLYYEVEGSKVQW